MLGQIMNRMGDAARPVFTPLQGQYLAFIHAYTLVNGRPPAEHEMMRFFRVTPPTVHRMVVTLEQAGLISRQPRMPRRIVVLLHEDHLPRLKPNLAQTVKTSVTRYSHVRHVK
jgi:DNA-binding MarR family transcriptional regulator